MRRVTCCSLLELRSTPKLVLAAGGEAMVKVCGVAMAMLSG
jgi:hypothetical protein